MKKTLLLIYAICAAWFCANAQVSSSDGFDVNPVGTCRTLNVFINIIYDQDSTANPIDNNDPFWPYSNVEGVTTTGPTYFDDYIDASYTTPQNVHGMFTRIYHESSFGQLILLGDMVVVNIKQSTVKPYGGGFSSGELIDNCLALMNSQSLNAKYGHNSISDYDSDGDYKIDFVQYFCRNGTELYGLDIPDGGFTSSGGFVKLNGVLKEIKNFSFQKAEGDISQKYKHLAIHEFAHHLFGGNEFHTSGGNHYSWSFPGPFMGMQGGWGLMGAANSSLVTCNAYERWRLNWTSSVYNPNGTRIQASTVNSDIGNTSGHKTFYLRDFVSTGDAVRIKLPYKDNTTSSEQYIWLENHQIDSNNKLDFFHWSNESCIPRGTPGIYAYYQVGMDSLSGDYDQVWPINKADNLKVISAEGNWDMVFDGTQYDCLNWGNRTVVKQIGENPLSGYNDQMEIFYNISTNHMIGKVNNSYGLVKEFENNSVDAALPAFGDDADAFTDNTKIGISTNPPSTNTVTYHVNQNEGIIEPAFSELDTRKVYLNGLQISFSIDGSDQFGDIYKVDIYWDKYDIENDLRWTGDIVLKESAILKTNKSIQFNQNKTPNQRDRILSIGEFSDATYFTCEDNSYLKMEDNSQITLDENSTFTLKSGSTLEINDGATFEVKNESKLVVEDGASVIIKGSGGISIMCGGEICVSSNASINLEDYDSYLSILDNGLTSPECSSNIASIVTGNGTFSTTEASDARFVVFPDDLTLECSDLVPPVAQIGIEVVPRNGIGVVYNGETRIDGDCPNSFVLKRSWTMTRSNTGLCGIEVTRTQTIVVNDDIAPQFVNFPTNVSMGISEFTSNNYDGSDVVGTDNCSSQLSVQYLGATIQTELCDYQNSVDRKWEISDGCNTRIVTQFVYLYDDVAPSFANFPANITVYSNNIPSVAQIGTDVVAEDNCGGNVSIVYTGQTITYTRYPMEYDVIRTWTATDYSGNSSSASQIISVVDVNVQSCSMPFSISNILSGAISKSYNSSLITISNTTFTGSNIDAEIFSEQGIVLGTDFTIGNGASLLVGPADCP